METQSPDVPFHVVIIGAGLSGLATAEHLRSRGFRVTILEAQPQAGGRIKTERSAFAENQYCELGAARIPSHHHRILHLAQSLGLNLIPFLPERGIYHNLYQGKLVTEDRPRQTPLSAYSDILSLAEQQQSMKGLESSFLDEAIALLGDFHDLGALGELAAHYDGLSFAEFLRERGASEAACDLFFFDMYARPFKDRVSSLFLLRNLGLLRKMETLYRIEGGNDQLPLALATRLKGFIHYRAAVTRIVQRPKNTYRIFYSEAGHPTTIDASHVVMAVPPPVLRRITFEPGLSLHKQRALASWRAMSPARIAIQFGQRFWRKSGANGFARIDTPGAIWEGTHFQEGESGILEFYLRNDEVAQRLERMDRDKALAFLCNIAEQALPGAENTHQLIRGHAACFWGRSPWARGGYSVLFKGDMLDAIQHTATPEGEIFFAGAHTSKHCVWMEGALEAAERVCQEVAEASKKKSEWGYNTATYDQQGEATA